MFVPNFSFLACLEVAEKLGWCGGWGGHVATVSKLNPSYLELLWVESSWVRVRFWQNKFVKNRVGGRGVTISLDNVCKYTVFFFWTLPLNFLILGLKIFTPWLFLQHPSWRRCWDQECRRKDVLGLLYAPRWNPKSCCWGKEGWPNWLTKFISCWIISHRSLCILKLCKYCQEVVDYNDYILFGISFKMSGLPSL